MAVGCNAFLFLDIVTERAELRPTSFKSKYETLKNDDDDDEEEEEEEDEEEEENKTKKQKRRLHVIHMGCCQTKKMPLKICKSSIYFRLRE